MSGKKVKFRVFSDDGARLSVEGATILDCFADDEPRETSPTAARATISKVLLGHDASIQVEYSVAPGDAALNVKWDQGTGTWETIPRLALTPQTWARDSNDDPKVTGAATSTCGWSGGRTPTMTSSSAG